MYNVHVYVAPIMCEIHLIFKHYIVHKRNINFLLLCLPWQKSWKHTKKKIIFYYWFSIIWANAKLRVEKKRKRKIEQGLKFYGALLKVTNNKKKLKSFKLKSFFPPNHRQGKSLEYALKWRENLSRSKNVVVYFLCTFTRSFMAYGVEHILSWEHQKGSSYYVAKKKCLMRQSLDFVV